MYQYVESGLENVWLKDWSVHVCPKCDGEYPDLPDRASVTPLIAEALIKQQSRLDFRAIRVLRMAMRLTSEGLAAKVGVNRVEVSRWENGKAAIDPHHDYVLRRIAAGFVVPEGRRAAAKEEVAYIFKQTYNERKDISAERIQVPA